MILALAMTVAPDSPFSDKHRCLNEGFDDKRFKFREFDTVAIDNDGTHGRNPDSLPFYTESKETLTK